MFEPTVSQTILILLASTLTTAGVVLMVGCAYLLARRASSSSDTGDLDSPQPSSSSTRALSARTLLLRRPKSLESACQGAATPATSQDYGTFSGFSNFSGVHPAALNIRATALATGSSSTDPPASLFIDAASQDYRVDRGFSGIYTAGAGIPSTAPLTAWASSIPPASLLNGFDTSESTDPLADYKAIHAFAKSGEGHVSVMRHDGTRQLVVIKSVRMKQRRDGTGYIVPSEVDMLTLQLGRHPNIINCQAFATEYPAGRFPVCNMLLDYCDAGDMFTFTDHWMRLQKYRGESVPSMFVLHFILSMIAALGYIHEGVRDTENSRSTRDADWKPIIQRDIKGGNIFLRWSADSKYGMPDITLGDFGFACYEHNSTGAHGTPGYYPPECKAVIGLADFDYSMYSAALDMQIMTRSSDIYTFGAVLYELMTLRYFNSDRDSYSPADLDGILSATPYGEPAIQSLLQQCLAEEPKDRITTQQLLSLRPFLDQTLADADAAGVRMPGYSWPEIELDTSAGAPRTASSAYPPEVLFDASDMSTVSGFTPPDKLCWCPNYGPKSKRRARPNCVRAGLAAASAGQAVAGAERVGIGARGIITGNVEAHAQSYAAEVLQSRFSDDSDRDYTMSF